MRKFLSFLMIFVLLGGIANAQFKVMFVNDDDQGGEGVANIGAALDNWGGLKTIVDLSDGTTAAPTYDEMSSYDMVIWYTGKDAGTLKIWDVSDTTGVGYTAAKYNSDLIQFASGGGIVWADMPDGFYDICGAAPDAFTAGTFVYDKLGISEYSVQTHTDADGTVGVSEANKTAANTFSSLNTVQWSWSTLWLADGFTLAAGATSLYEMGPSGYALAGYPMMVMNGNYITSSMRIAKFGDGSATVQATVNTFITDIVSAVENGDIVAGVKTIEKSSVKLYPNPVTEYATISLSENNKASQITIFDITGKIVYTQSVKAGQDATINTSNFSSGLYTVSILSDNKISTTKMSVVK